MLSVVFGSVGSSPFVFSGTEQWEVFIFSEIFIYFPHFPSNQTEWPILQGTTSTMVVAVDLSRNFV